MERIMKALTGYLERDGRKVWHSTQQPYVMFLVNSDSGHWVCLAEAREAEEQVLVHMMFPLRVPRERLSAVQEYITRANVGLVIGNFELDLDDGYLAYKTSLDVEGVELEPGLLHPLFEHAVNAVDMHVAGLMPVIFGDLQPTDGLDRVQRYTLAQVVNLVNDLMDE